MSLTVLISCTECGVAHPVFKYPFVGTANECSRPKFLYLGSTDMHFRQGMPHRFIYFGTILINNMRTSPLAQSSVCAWRHFIVNIWTCSITVKKYMSYVQKQTLQRVHCHSSHLLFLILETTDK